MVWWSFVPSSCEMESHRYNVNCDPLSEDMSMACQNKLSNEESLLGHKQRLMCWREEELLATW